MPGFTHLHLHTEYSLLDGVNRVKPLIAKVKESGMDSVGISDHGVLYGVFDFWNTAKAAGIKPIIGCELYVSPQERTLKKEVDGDRYYHLLFIAKNLTGYKNLMRLVSRAYLEGFYYRPRADRDLIKEYSEGLIVTSACMGSPVGTNILKGREKQAREWIEFLAETFKNDFYLELQRGYLEGTDDFDTADLKQYDYETQDYIKKQSKLNKKLIEFSKEYNLPLIATTDAHYLDSQDALTQEVLFCVKDGKHLDDPSRRKAYHGTYVKTPEEMYQAFKDIPSALENTVKIADEVEEYDITFDRVQPIYPDKPEGKTAKESLLAEVYKGAEERYGKLTDELKNRINYEIEVIDTKGYCDYFLVIGDCVRWALERNIPVSVRGSVAGSVTAYCLGIANVEPIKWELNFERFLNPERPSPPDIDLDIPDVSRDKMVKYVEDKYGKDNVALVCTFGRMKTKAAIRDVCRVMGIDLRTADELSKMVHMKYGKVKPLAQMMEDDPEFAGRINGDSRLTRMKEIVSAIEGMARHVSIHACGVLITPEPITNYVPVQTETGGGGKIITQVEGEPIESLGLMKFDFLGLRTLTILKNTLELIKESRGDEIKLLDIPLDDKKTYELFQQGETTAVFQFESGGMRNYLQKLKPENIEDLCFMVAAYRPGPMQFIDPYIECKYGKRKVEYLVPELEPILAKTYGFAVYQEQVIRIAVDIAGYSMGEADILRRAVGKKKLDVMKKEEKRFKEGVVKKGYSKEVAEQLWSYLLPFADYGFPKAHAAAYCTVAYWTAYLKVRYPLEFIASLIQSDINDSDRLIIDMGEAERLGIKVLPPDINKSGVQFKIEGDGEIRYGLGAIKGANSKTLEELARSREEKGEYRTFADVFMNPDFKHLHKKTIEILVKAGVMDRFGDRNHLLELIPSSHSGAERQYKQKMSGQVGLFGEVATGESGGFGSAVDAGLVGANNTAQPATNAEKLAWEKEYLGIYFSSHPITKHMNALKEKGIVCGFKEIEDSAAGNSKVRVGCTIKRTRKITTKKGDPMAFVTLEALDGEFDGVLFPRVFNEHNEMLEHGTLYVIEGRIDERNGRKSFIVDAVHSVDSIDSAFLGKQNASREIPFYSNDSDFDDPDFDPFASKTIHVNIPKGTSKEKVRKLKEILLNNPGDAEVVLRFENGDGKREVKLKQRVDYGAVSKIFGGG